MTVKRFTEQEKLLLRKNPYTYRVTDNMILLTVEFKETFWKLYIQGFSPVSIFRELGYDPDLLGQYRINNFAFRILSLYFAFKLKKAIESGKSLTQGVGGEIKTPPKNKDYSELPIEATIASMQYELSYLRQEVEFLKKMCCLDKSD